MKYHSSFHYVYNGQGINNLKEKNINNLNNICQDMILEEVTREKKEHKKLQGMSGSLNLIWKWCIRACRNLWHFPELPETLNIFDPFPRVFMLTESLFHHLSTASLECIKNIFWDWVHEEDDTVTSSGGTVRPENRVYLRKINEKWFSCGYLLQHEPCFLIWSMSNRALQLFLKWQNKEEWATLHGH